MKDCILETVVDPMKEARRYVENAREVLLIRGKYDPEIGSYGDRKHVRAAGHYLWNGVLVILNAAFHVETKRGRVDIENYRMAISPRDRKLLTMVNNAYDILHLNMGYDGVLDRKICDRGFSVATDIIDRCARLLPQAAV